LRATGSHAVWLALCGPHYQKGKVDEWISRSKWYLFESIKCPSVAIELKCH